MHDSDGKKRKAFLAQISAHCAECGARTCSILKDADAEALNRLSFAKKSMVYLKGQCILREGLESHGLYFIHGGKVKVFKTNGHDKQVILRLAKAGEMIGYDNAFTGGPQEASAMALEDTRICYIDQDTFLQIAREYPDIAINLLKYFSRLLMQAEAQNMKMARLHVQAKVADALCTIHETFGVNVEDRCLNLQLSRQDLADLAGSTKEQVSKTLTEFKSQGLLEVRGKRIRILDFTALAEVAAA